MILIDDLESLILDLVCLEIKTETAISPNQQKSSDEILFNFRHKKLLRISAKWREKDNDGSREYANLLNRAGFEYELKKHFMKFIGELQIPTYNKVKSFNFYDVLLSFLDF
jgi:hypothetical protein